MCRKLLWICYLCHTNHAFKFHLKRRELVFGNSFMHAFNNQDSPLEGAGSVQSGEGSSRYQSHRGTQPAPRVTPARAGHPWRPPLEPIAVAKSHPFPCMQFSPARSTSLLVIPPSHRSLHLGRELGSNRSVSVLRAGE